MYRPPLYKQESWYGYFGRLSLQSLLPESRIKEHFYGSKDFNVSLHFLTKPNLLLSRGLYTRSEVEELISNHSLINYFKSVMSLERQEVIDRRQWEAPENWSVSNYLGYNRCRKLSAIPKYCQLCNREQMEEFGELFFNRFHQIPEIRVCQKHRCYLNECILEPLAPLKYRFFRPTKECCPISTIAYCDSTVTLDLAKFHTRIAEGTYKIDFDYVKRARELGYSKGSRVNQVKIAYDYNRFFSQTISHFPRYSNLIFEQEEISDSYRHLLLDYFFFVKSENGIPADYDADKGLSYADPEKLEKDSNEVNRSLESKITDLQRAVEIVKSKMPPIRITRTTILKEANLPVRVRLVPKLEKLVDRSIESLEEFRIRRLHYVAKRLQEQGKHISPSSILFKASIRNPSSKLKREAQLLDRKISSP